MIEIKISDPHLMDKKVLLQTAKFLFELSGHALAEMPVAKTVPPVATKTLELQEPIQPCPVPMPVVPSPVPNGVPVPPTPFQKTEVPTAPVNPFLGNPFLNVPQADVEHVAAPPLFAIPDDTKLMAVPSATIPSVDLDIHGLPWDGRIHARTATKVQDGSWKMKRGIDPALVTQVQAELRSAITAPAANSGILRTNGSISPPSILEVAETPAPVTNDFPAFMNKVSAIIAENKLTKPRVIEILNEFGLASVPVVATRPDLIPAIMMRLDEELNGATV